jgi:hypothetical protein
MERKDSEPDPPRAAKLVPDTMFRMSSQFNTTSFYCLLLRNFTKSGRWKGKQQSQGYA